MDGSIETARKTSVVDERKIDQVVGELDKYKVVVAALQESNVYRVGDSVVLSTLDWFRESEAAIKPLLDSPPLTVSNCAFVISRPKYSIHLNRRHTMSHLFVGEYVSPSFGGATALLQSILCEKT